MRRTGVGVLPLTLTGVSSIAMILVMTAAAHAFINPNFTPIHLKDQSDLILVLKFDGTVKDGKATATVTKAMKGEAPARPLTFDFFAGAFEAQGKAVCQTIIDGTREAMLFVGFFEAGDEGGMAMGGEEEARGMLHLGGRWIVLTSVEKDLWDMEKIDSRMLGTWAGSTDMLLRAMEYILSDPDADVPVRTNAEWGEHVMFAKIEGEVREAAPVDLDGDGRPYLFVVCEKGDRLFRFTDGKFADVTAQRKLASKSSAALWTDVNRDGKLDLVTSTGTDLSTWKQQADGTFTCAGALVPTDREMKCVGLSVVVGDASVLVVSTSGSPLLVTLRKDGTAGPSKSLVEGEFPGKDFGVAGKCLVADFDGDAVPDILQPFESGGLFYRGTKPGEFAAPARAQLGLGKGRSAAAVGDYDADGLPDIFTTAEDANRIWHNLGKAQFVETLGVSGEIAYISKSGGVSAMTGDVNNDGRQDILIGYAGMPPHIFFNRGFRSFGHSHQLDLGEQKLLPQAGDGQQAACLGDFDGNGAEDMVLVLRNGEVWYFPRRALDRFALAVTVALRPGEAEPVMVTGWSGRRCLGAWPVTSGGPPAFFGLVDAGPVTLKWRFPGAEPQTQEVLVVDRPVHFTPRPKE